MFCKPCFQWNGMSLNGFALVAFMIGVLLCCLAVVVALKIAPVPSGLVGVAAFKYLMKLRKL